MKYVLFFLLPAVVLSFGIFHVSSNHKAILTSKADAVTQPGYETQPAIYNIEASPAYTWSKTHSVPLIVVAYILLAIAAGYVYWANKKVKSVNILAILLCVVLAYLAVFIKYDTKTFAKTVDTATYEANKDNLDKCFP